MKAITIQQPFASAIIAGIKTVENRSWPTRYRGPLAIHAGLSTKYFKCLPFQIGDFVHNELGSLKKLPRGFLLGVVDMVDCVNYNHKLESDPFADGPICWILKNPRALAEPIPWKGKQGLWNVTDEILTNLT